MKRLDDIGLDVTGLADRVAELFRTRFLNADGLISRQCPPTTRTLFDNLDDVAPFLIYFGHADFLVEQVSRLTPASFENLLAQGQVLHSYKIDEYLGGLNAIAGATDSSHAQKLLDDAVAKCLGYFFIAPDQFAETFDLVSRQASPYFSPWSAGLLETFLEIDSPTIDLAAISNDVLKRWVSHPYFTSYGLFPFRGSFDPLVQRREEAMAARGRWCGEPPTRGAEGRWRNLVARLPAVHALRTEVHRRYRSGHWSQLMKSNTTPIFLSLELHSRNGEPCFRDVVQRWIESVELRLISPEGDVRSAWHEDGSVGVPTLVAAFIVIDVLCEAHVVLGGERDWLGLAARIATRQLELAWENGLIPMYPGSDRDHLDGQVDFSISLRRLAELCGREDWLQRSFVMAGNALVLHWTNDGFCTHLDRGGRPVVLPSNTVDPKYNGLALKALVHLAERDALIYHSPHLADLFKDR
jgi:hypothetical protein